MPPTIQELEAALINADNAGDVEAATAIAADMDILMKAQQQPQQPTGPDYKTMSGMEVAERAVKNIPSDIYNLGAQTVEAVASPVQTTTGLIDLASAGMSKVLDVTGLSKYADPEKMEKYRQVRGMVSKELGDVFTKEGLKQRIAEKPITSLLDLSFIGQGVSAPAKATRVGGMVNKFSKAIDPTQIVTKPAGVAFEKISDAAQIKAAQYAPELEKVKSFVKSGFVIPPSQVKGTGVIKKTAESLLGEKTPFKASVKNQEVINSKIRKFVNVGEDVPLENVMEVISKRTQPVYDEVAKIKPIRVSKAQTVPQSKTGAMGEVIELPPKKISSKKTRSGQQILTDLEKQRATTSKLYKDAKNKAARDNNANIEGYKKAESALKKQQKLENELEELASLSGNKDLAARLKEARAERAKGHSIENAIDKGDLNATLFARQNKKRYVTGEGKEIIDFAEAYPNLVKRQKAPDIIPKNLRDITKQGIEAGLAFQFLGGPLGVAGLYGAKAVTPSLLLGKRSQAALGMADFMPTGSSLLKGLANQPAVTGATYIPSLLESSDIELARYL